MIEACFNLFLKMRDTQADLGFGQGVFTTSLQNSRWPVSTTRMPDHVSISVLTTQPIYNPFKLDCKWRQKWCQFYHRIVKCKNFEMDPRYSVSPTNHQLTLKPFHAADSLKTNHPMSKITELVITQETSQQKRCIRRIYFYSFLPIYDSKFKI